MPQTAYRATLARLASGHNSPTYYELPAYLRGLADAADSARDAFAALSEASRQARAARAWAAIERLDGAELGAYNAWQELERIGAELLDAAGASSTASTDRTPALAAAGPGRPVLTVVWLFLALGALGLGALAGLGIALARIAAAADTRRAFLALDTAARRAERAPDGRPLSASEIRARVTADQWFREDRLSVAGYGALCNLMYRGEDAYPYLSGGPSGTAVVWAQGRRWPVEEWNADAEHDAGAHDGASARGGAA